MIISTASFPRNNTNLKNDLNKHIDSQKAKILPRFFKTGTGEYGEGDIFIGVTVPNIRKVAKKYSTLSLSAVNNLLSSPIHEERLCALVILVGQFNTGDYNRRKTIFSVYLSNTSSVNNWDLVDSSAPHIVGGYLADKPRDVLYKLARSKSLWERRIAIVATLYFIVKLKEYEDTFAVAEILVNDTHDLIHKAVGWMLREVGKHVNQETEELFLKKHYKHMPRTMLRYAIERFPEEIRRGYLHGTI